MSLNNIIHRWTLMIVMRHAIGIGFKPHIKGDYQPKKVIKYLTSNNKLKQAII
jgi:hypothetical protein